jgi:hypothetical protein
MDRFDLNQVYDSDEVRNKMITDLNKERIQHLEQFTSLDENIISAMKSSLRTK